MSGPSSTECTWVRRFSTPSASRGNGTSTRTRCDIVDLRWWLGGWARASGLAQGRVDLGAAVGPEGIGGAAREDRLRVQVGDEDVVAVVVAHGQPVAVGVDDARAPH